MPKSFVAFAALACLSLSALADPVTLQSPANRVNLLELYTSEGCSSCPPADRWLSGLKGDARLWKQVVPVAFHVDYWDDIGWPDRFASAAYGNRQRHYAQTWGTSSVYTPGIVLDGKEWRSWFSRPDLKAPLGPEVGSLTLSIDGQQAAATFATKTQLPERLELNLALLGFGLSTQVKAGENSGRTLDHDFVVLGHKQMVLTRASNGSYRGEITLPEAHVAAPRKGLAAWVSVPGDPRPIQAVGGWL
ncbi:MAG: DUF1223 domain-containing protein [Gammaproteobacteria bacterium]